MLSNLINNLIMDPMDPESGFLIRNFTLPILVYLSEKLHENNYECFFKYTYCYYMKQILKLCLTL